MKNMDELMSNLVEQNNLEIEDIPDIDLYMDQVIQLFENKFTHTKRHQDEKVLTKTMINNYAKGKLFFPIKNKKYSKEHLLLISLIYQLKGALSINDIKKVLDGVNDKILEEEKFDLDKLYESYLYLAEQNSNRFKKNVEISSMEIRDQVKELNDKDSDYIETFLSIASLVHISNLYRKTAEKMIDEITNDTGNE
ncbi:DUF1836 domain-containing protein [Aquibacillus sp. 3ASR75-11]|uniref:DUF1836 domain-containing protein n=1 Tax=Terrihalobacillus insolitus TaxID=2950438 RepID=A0A9X4AM04_9BACI|nr:DUF1836 domain-containing protein [Terrihalobacillus insolitus]MDC3412312.1 DUF1836 domain-containing protein [Terrihalobacillus insolitus]MDC3422995.1 DUF1836 domain-containing protein [Terrihalobacillus insolitus]